MAVAAVLLLLLAVLHSGPAQAQTVASETRSHSQLSGTDNSDSDAEAAMAAPVSAPGVHSDLDRARNLFAYGDYAAATRLLEELVLPGRLEREKDLIDAHRMLGVAAYLAGQQDLARRMFMALLYLEPDTKLDPFLTPPAVVEFFNAIVAELGDKLDEVRAKQQGKKKVPRVKVVERRMRIRSWYQVLMPLGFSQFERGSWLWGSLFLVTQGCGLGVMSASLAGSWLLLEEGSLRDDVRPAYQALRVANWAAGGLTAASYIAGVIDAWIQFEEETIESERLVELPRDQLPDVSRRWVEES